MYRAFLLPLLFLGIFTCRLPAQVATYTLKFDQASYIYNVGGPDVPVSVYLQWDGTGTNLLATDGLGLAQFGLRFSDSTAGVNTPVATMANFTVGSGIITNASNSPNSFQFENPVDVYQPGDTGFTGINQLVGLGYANAVAPTFSTTWGSLTNAVYLGTFYFNGNIAGSMKINPGLLNPSAPPNFESWSFTNMDSNINFSPATFTVQSVPEPGSMILAGLSLAGMAGAYRWRRRQCGQVKATETVA